MTASVVVTGCGTGIGRAIFERLIADGWAVVGLELDAARAADARASRVPRMSSSGDAGDRGDLRRARDRAVEVAPLGGWVNNAALPIQGNLHDPRQDEVERMFRVSLMGYYWGCSEAVQQFVLQKGTGAIVNISSIHARAAFNGWAAYDIAKGGVNALTRYIAVEYGPVGIRANAIEPGAIRTPLLQQVIDRRSRSGPHGARHGRHPSHEPHRRGIGDRLSGFVPAVERRVLRERPVHRGRRRRHGALLPVRPVIRHPGRGVAAGPPRRTLRVDRAWRVPRSARRLSARPQGRPGLRG